MPNTLRTPRHEGLRRLLVESRKAADLTQADVAKKLGRYQSYVGRVESGERRVDVVEFLAFAEAIGFDPRAAIGKLSKIR
jgi:transcriptional regulator with XRE-family HTH domain